MRLVPGLPDLDPGHQVLQHAGRSGIGQERGEDGDRVQRNIARAAEAGAHHGCAKPGGRQGKELSSTESSARHRYSVVGRHCKFARHANGAGNAR